MTHFCRAACQHHDIHIVQQQFGLNGCADTWIQMWGLSHHSLHKVQASLFPISNLSIVTQISNINDNLADKNEDLDLQGNFVQMQERKVSC